jgi:hypothetical protein
MSWEVQLAEQIKNRDNLPVIAPVSGRVISGNRVSVFDGRAVITGTMAYGFNPEPGTKVLCIPGDGGQWFIVCRLA